MTGSSLYSPTLVPGGGTNVAAMLQHATALVRASLSERSYRVLLVTDGRSELEAARAAAQELAACYQVAIWPMRAFRCQLASSTCRRQRSVANDTIVRAGVGQTSREEAAANVVMVVVTASAIASRSMGPADVPSGSRPRRCLSSIPRANSRLRRSPSARM